jgi:tryptophan-rich sensory protein
MSLGYGRRAIDRREIGILIGFVVVCELVGILGALATAPAIETWYTTIAKPGFTPPSWVFGPVWTSLYLLMGVAAFLIWRRREKRPRAVRLALGAFAVQLALNGLWSLAFFGLRSPALGLLVIVPLLVALLATTGLFARVSRPAAALLVPYVAWVAYATALNAAIWGLN